MNNNHNFLFLIWKSPKSRRNYIIGKLSRKNKYMFEYFGEYKEAQKEGWELLEAFPQETLYESDTLFAAFASRLPDPKRKNINTILSRYSLDEYDGYELLRRSTGRLPFDTYEFIDPIFPEEETIQRDFFIVGIRHNADCEGTCCERFPSVTLGEELKLQPEPDNAYDQYAIRVYTERGEMIGYIPRYYSESVASRLNKESTYSCVIIELNKQDCENCMKVRLKIPRDF